MEVTQTIKDKIELRFHELSKAQQKVANFVLSNPTFIGVHSAAEVGDKAGTSETTVIRFCYALGLEGYAQLQKEITLFVFKHTPTSTLGNYISSKKELFDDQCLIENGMSQDSSKIVGIAKQIDKQLFSEATRKLHEAKNIYIVGAGASLLAAQWLHFTMNILRPNVKLFQTETAELIRTLQEIDEHSVVVVISLHRYYKEPIQIAAALHERGIPVLAITDSRLAPIHKHCDYAFFLEQAELSTIDLMPALVSFLNILVTGMMTFDPEYYNTQRVKYDDFQNSFIADRWS
ncbi:MurR/RpiR family transcriptional regulator [Neobacillus sp. DY30]|uniref:MurR/RpiR family transcriptional regulator n=1 Tax=Neobacillus sp. DY30 TaxID=3047871 RepID=UPI0024C06502|nr:MurR/RpiR family transcriptional regulator [Neobacillus sp. DY30]WHX97970.1 MurR/RpiR family transcriptional regulator [Neobacillus sp. DY30]